MNIPQLIAHRGYAQHYPENTLIALRKAVRAGACYVEFDVQLTADGIPVLLHDATLQRIAGVDAAIHEITLDEARTHAFGEPGRFGATFNDVRIATLSEVVQFLRGTPKTRVFVEIKRASLREFGVEKVMSAILNELPSISNQCALISFDESALRYARKKSSLPIGWVFEPWSEDALSVARDLRPEFVFTDADTLPPEVATLPQGPWQWALYEVADPEMAVQLAARGASLIETFAIGEMLRHPQLRTRGCLGE
jgi:glycerophosphoryl diester phosphodiesterase